MLSGLDSDLRAYALAILTEVPGWRATADEWEYLAGLVDAVGTALAGRDWTALGDAVDELERSSPLRAKRLGAQPEKPVEPPPRPIRERTNRLVHELRDGQSPGPEPRPNG